MDKDGESESESEGTPSVSARTSRSSSRASAVSSVKLSLRSRSSTPSDMDSVQSRNVSPVAKVKSRTPTPSNISICSKTSTPSYISEVDDVDDKISEHSASHQAESEDEKSESGTPSENEGETPPPTNSEQESSGTDSSEDSESEEETEEEHEESNVPCDIEGTPGIPADSDQNKDKNKSDHIKVKEKDPWEEEVEKFLAQTSKPKDITKQSPKRRSQSPRQSPKRAASPSLSPRRPTFSGRRSQKSPDRRRSPPSHRISPPFISHRSPNARLSPARHRPLSPRRSVSPYASHRSPNSSLPQRRSPVSRRSVSPHNMGYKIKGSPTERYTDHRRNRSPLPPQRYSGRDRYDRGDIDKVRRELGSERLVPDRFRHLEYENRRDNRFERDRNSYRQDRLREDNRLSDRLKMSSSIPEQERNRQRISPGRDRVYQTSDRGTTRKETSKAKDVQSNDKAEQIKSKNSKRDAKCVPEVDQAKLEARRRKFEGDLNVKGKVKISLAAKAEKRRKLKENSEEKVDSKLKRVSASKQTENVKSSKLQTSKKEIKKVEKSSESDIDSDSEKTEKSDIFDSDSESDTEGASWRFSHTGSTAGHKAAVPFERRPSDIATEKRVRRTKEEDKLREERRKRRDRVYKTRKSYVTPDRDAVQEKLKLPDVKNEQQVKRTGFESESDEEDKTKIRSTLSVISSGKHSSKVSRKIALDAKEADPKVKETKSEHKAKHKKKSKKRHIEEVEEAAEVDEKKLSKMDARNIIAQLKRKKEVPVDMPEEVVPTKRHRRNREKSGKSRESPVISITFKGGEFKNVNSTVNLCLITDTDQFECKLLYFYF